MEYTIDALNKLKASLGATGVLSKDYSSIIMSYAMASASEGHKNGRKAEREQNVEPLLQSGDQLQSAASRMAEFLRGQEINMPYEVSMATLEAERAVGNWTKARKNV